MATKKRPTSEAVPTPGSAKSEAGKYGAAAKKSPIIFTATPGAIAPIDLPEVAAKLVKTKKADRPAYEKSKQALPSATIEALRDLATGNLTRYADEDDMFTKLGIKVGKKKA
jgi:hypothetical protein